MCIMYYINYKDYIYISYIDDIKNSYNRTKRQTTQIKNGQRIQKDISPEMIHLSPTGT